MDYQVSVISIAFMGVSALAGLAIPIVLFLVLKRKFRLETGPFFIGCAVFLLFALVLEGILNNLILSSAAGAAIVQNVFLTAAFGGLMAGIFEETGRYVAFRTVLKKKLPNAHNALLYGAGHGGVEAFVILSMGMISNLVFSVLINAGMAEKILAQMPDAAALAQYEAAFAALAQTEPAMFLVGILERIAAVALHLTLSVLVWFAARDKRRFFLFPLAIFLHALVNFTAVVLAKVGSIWLAEGAIYLITLACALFARALWKREDAGRVAEDAAQEGEGEHPLA